MVDISVQTTEEKILDVLRDISRDLKISTKLTYKILEEIKKYGK